jgi:hypothetical protein
VRPLSNVAAQGRPLTKDEEREAKAVTSALGNAFRGKPVTNDLGLSWIRHDGLQPGRQEHHRVRSHADPAKAPSGKVHDLARPSGRRRSEDKKIVRCSRTSAPSP